MVNNMVDIMSDPYVDGDWCCCHKYRIPKGDVAVIFNDIQHEPLGKSGAFCGPKYKHELRDVTRERDLLLKAMLEMVDETRFVTMKTPVASPLDIKHVKEARDLAVVTLRSLCPPCGHCGELFNKHLYRQSLGCVDGGTTYSPGPTIPPPSTAP